MSRDWWDWLPHHPANQKDDDNIEEEICVCCGKNINEDEKYANCRFFIDGICDECDDSPNED